MDSYVKLSRKALWFNEGQKARSRGNLLNTCPYKQTLKAKCWIEGWLYADKHAMINGDESLAVFSEV